jgi:small basic protein (TIGR04137 family)
MSQHKSFKKNTSNLKKKRNVLKRFERIEILYKNGQLKKK